MKACKCSERSNPIEIRRWTVLVYKAIDNVFTDIQPWPSDYSTVMCQICKATWRTKAKYVENLPKQINKSLIDAERRKKMKKLNRTEASLLLYLETREVDHAGVVDTVHMNDEDMTIAKEWNKKGYIKFGRICADDVMRLSSFNQKCTHWCELSEEAWKDAHHQRRERAARMAKNRTYERTEEKQ